MSRSATRAAEPRAHQRTPRRQKGSGDLGAAPALKRRLMRAYRQAHHFGECLGCGQWTKRLRGYQDGEEVFVLQLHRAPSREGDLPSPPLAPLCSTVVKDWALLDARPLGPVHPPRDAGPGLMDRRAWVVLQLGAVEPADGGPMLDQVDVLMAAFPRRRRLSQRSNRRGGT